ncbi:uncharacterized protein MKK02DRAFT_37529 [Dioszegia hungarica]|uniref:G-patch domain-containing protein n=1 Tax=Dioszegia hungarica TaxID=4972 RepID=A0AA38LUA5_9TREE|nr:uncharacterized protein MKK02DRAFT_37529 [Dioszegia hungarica]KAI9634649.1 hypothetical protein MKK02DRAFT_37529 [Dioszegia hungarica]
MSKRFDPAEHLSKQGWKGKGTALKTGHLTRPLAVVQKKTLSGVGKDRDEAVPFWDQIFAATAASLSLPSTPLSTSPAPSSPNCTAITPKLADPRTNKSGSWQTSGTSSSAPRGQGGLSVGVRVSRDMARRGLYSKFFRGAVVQEEELEESAAKVEVDGQEQAEAGPSRLPSTPIENSVQGDGKDEGDGDVRETKEERRARRAEKAKRKEEKAERRAARAAAGPNDEEDSAEQCEALATANTTEEVALVPTTAVPDTQRGMSEAEEAREAKKRKWKEKRKEPGYVPKLPKRQRQSSKKADGRER